MADLTSPITDCQLEESYKVLKTEFENGSERRRLKRAAPESVFKVTSPMLTKTDRDTLRTFYREKYGNLTSFTWTHPGDLTDYTVRFEGPLSERFVSPAYYQLSYSLKVVA